MPRKCYAKRKRSFRDKCVPRLEPGNEDARVCVARVTRAGARDDPALMDGARAVAFGDHLGDQIGFFGGNHLG